MEDCLEVGAVLRLLQEDGFVEMQVKEPGHK